MKIIAVKTEVLKSSINLNAEKTEATFQANAWIAVEGNPYPELVTPKTIFNLTCPAAQLVNIEEVAEAQVNAYVEQNYPIVND
jgi:hypothetical protein